MRSVHVGSDHSKSALIYKTGNGMARAFYFFLMILSLNAVRTSSSNVTDSVFDYSTVSIPYSTIPADMIPTSPIPSVSYSQSPPLSLPSSSPSSPLLTSQSVITSIPPSDLNVSSLYQMSVIAPSTSRFDFNSTAVFRFETTSVVLLSSSPSSHVVASQSSFYSPSPSTIQVIESSFQVMSSLDMKETQSEISTTTTLVASPSIDNSASSQIIARTTLAVVASSVPMPTTPFATSQIILPSPSVSILSSPIIFSPSQTPFPSLSVSSQYPSQSSISNIIASSSNANFAPTQSLQPTPIQPTPSPTVVTSSQPTVSTAGPDQLSILEWFGIAVGGAAVLFILFLLYHCYQVRQREVRKQKKQMKKEILDFSQSNRNDRISSWRNSLALDAMATHIELPQEDSMDMQSMDNLGFEEVFLGDESKSSANNNYFLPQTNL